MFFAVLYYFDSKLKELGCSAVALCSDSADTQLRCLDWFVWVFRGGRGVLFPSLEDDFAFQSSVKGDGIQPDSLLDLLSAALLLLAAFKPL